MVDRKTIPVVSSISPTPVFHKIGVIGLGLIGGSIALAARKVWPSALVIGVDKKGVLEHAMQLHAIDVASDDPVVLADADVVFLAAPVAQNIKLLGVLSEHVSGRAIVSDVGSTKRAIVEAAEGLPARFDFIGGHPLAGAARGGIRYARADLFVGRPWLLTPVGDGQVAAIAQLSRFVESLGGLPHTMGVAEHDRLVAALIHLPQLTASALMHVLGERLGREGLRLAGRGVRETTRLASSPVDVWRDACGSNADEITAALDDLIVVLEALRADLGEGARLHEVFESANAWREVLMATTPKSAKENG